ncbi:MAG: hypothetical protein HUJ67_07700 [Ruminiclostridium sp.]|nr:hypothetical protein [Ruminiclostridium sp.]
MKDIPQLTIRPHTRPKVLLLGNGMNRVYGGASWAGLLQKINRTAFTPEEVKGIPLPMQAVLLSEDHVDSSLKELKKELTQCELHPWLDEQLKKLLTMPFDCILTPNFTYELECAADPNFLEGRGRWGRYQRHTPAIKRAEQRFMLHTYYSMPTDRGEVPLFHVHGEARKPESVILGHYFYGNLLFRYDDYLTRQAPNCRYPAEEAGKGRPVMSWLDYFILGDVYSLGFGFDTAEMDLWWLLCRKKRELAPHGDLFFFEPDRKATITKIALLQAYNARQLSLGFRELDPEGYRDFYETAVETIGRMVAGG